MPPDRRPELLDAGRALAYRWCDLNGVDRPYVTVYDEGEPQFGVCAYYRSGRIRIWTRHCARPGLAGRAWSWPGYSTDRTPYGVVCHELAHHVEGAHGARGGIVAGPWRLETGEKPLTSYCPDDNEWFAEIFRLYVTNPSLLAYLRPRTFARLEARWPYHAETRPWAEVLAGSPRHVAVAAKKVEFAEKSARRAGRVLPAPRNSVVS